MTEIFLVKLPAGILIGPYRWQVNIGSGNGLVPSGTKPLPEPMLTQIYVAMRRHQAMLNHRSNSMVILS